jgi:DNA-binding MarR family transcriptional regulator
MPRLWFLLDLAVEEAALSGKVVGWAFEQGRQRSLSPTQRYVLVAYGDNANEAEGKCWPDKGEIIDKTGYSQATVYRAVRELETEGLLTFAKDEKGRECVYLSVPWDSQGENRNSQSENRNSQPEKNHSQSEKRSNKGTVKEPSKNRRTVDRKPVTKAELSLAAVVVDLFNSAAGTDAKLDAHLTPIVMRIRERPEYGERQHRAIIEATLEGERWWSGPPTLRIIYGNPGAFESAIEKAREKQKQKRSEEDDPNAERERVRREFAEAEDAD